MRRPRTTRNRTRADEDPRGVLPRAGVAPCVAILIVFFFHAGGLLSPAHRKGTLEPPPWGFVRAGHVGVDLFFVLLARKVRLFEP
jgi:peptidoglycan/LPS O-acetylase OafA/YrhL